MIVEVCETRGIIINMPINELHDFPSHPYKLHEESEMESLKASIQAEGVHTPLLVWHTPEQGYTVISGHRRLYACRALGKRGTSAQKITEAIAASVTIR